MKKIKTRSIVKNIKVLDKTIDVTRKAKNAYVRTREQAEHTQQVASDNYTDYAGDKIKNSSETVIRKSGHNVKHQAKKAMQKLNKHRLSKTGKGTIKSANKTVKTAGRTAKTAIKTSQRTVKTAEKTAKQSAKITKQAALAAKRAAITAAKAAKYTVKAVIVAVKAAITAIKGLISIISAGGWVAIVIVLIIAIVSIVASSPFGIFINESDGTTPTISEVVQDINQEYSSKIYSIIADANDVNEIIIEGESSDAEYIPINWIDVLGVFSVKATMNDSPNEYMDVLFMDEEKEKELRSIFWDMNSITYEIQEKIMPTPSPTPSATSTPSASPTPEATPEVIRTLIITMEGKTYEQGAEIFKFSDVQNAILEEVMSSEYVSMFMDLCGMNTFNGLTSEQLSQLVNDLPHGELGSVIIEYALSRLGDPYSQAKRGQGNYVDCSYLARWCYRQAGVSQFAAGTAAEQARYCVDNGLTIAKSNLQPGDLIFWSFNKNGRFMNITHVGIYAGNGMVIDASSSRGMVVYREIFGAANQVCYGRPHVFDN